MTLEAPTFPIPPLSGDILALNFDAPATPTLSLTLADTQKSRNTSGWGLGWYPVDGPAAMLAKDPIARGTQIQASSLTDWSSFRSTVFLCKVLGANERYTQSESQPFSRSFAGRDWLFLHNGDLDKPELEKLHGRMRRLLEPVGSTDSELAFCYLLSRLQEERIARTLADLDPQKLLAWFQSLDALGSADMCLSDGLSLVCYHGTRSPKQMYYCRVQPPFNLASQQSAVAQLALGDPRDNYRTVLIFSSAPFTTAPGVQMQPGQLVMSRRGAIVWDSLAASNSGTSGSWKPDPAVNPALMVPAAESRSRFRYMNTRSVTTAPDGRALGYRTFSIRHATHYTYAQPVEHSTHLLRLQPNDDHIQEVVRATLTLSSNAEQIQYEDVFGNQAIHCTINEPYTKLSVEAESIVKVYAAPPDDHSLSRRQNSIPLVWMPWQRQMMGPYVLPIELPESQLRELTDYAMSFVERNRHHLLHTLEDINTSIYRDYAYRPGTTALSTTPFEVYTSRQGVCQDFANLFICLARLLSIPARYRMGYIYTGANYANKIQSDASHAWVEVYLPYVGWRGFDPTNGCNVAQDHVRVACGRDYGDATPTSGTIYRGGGGEYLSVDVKVEEIFDQG